MSRPQPVISGRLFLVDIHDEYRLTGIHKSTEKGTIESGNPWGSTDKYSLVRYEEIVDGTQTMLVDGPNNIIKINGKDYAGDVQKLLR